MKRYCLVNVIKPEFLDEYIQAHRNAWPEFLECLELAGTTEELIYMYENLAIIFVTCEDMDSYMEKYAKSEIGQRWLQAVLPFVAANDFAEKDGQAKESPSGLPKIFDLQQQIQGIFTPF